MSLLVDFAESDAGLRVHVRSLDRKLPAQLALAILADDLYAGDVVAKVGRRRAEAEFDVVLPGIVMAATLDLIDIATGLSILRAPYDLQSFYGLRMSHAAVEGGFMHGALSVRRMDRHVLIEFIGEGRVLARGLATRRDAGGTDYTFRLPLLSTVGPYDRLRLDPRIAGKHLHDGAVTVTAANAGYAGVVDTNVGGIVSGWAIDVGSSGNRVSLDLLLNGEVVDTVVADQPRDDLRGAGLGDGLSAFTFRIKPSREFHSPRQMSVVISGTRMELQGSPFAAPPPPPIRGFFDGLHGTSAHGWAINDLDPATPLVVEAVCDGAVLATARAHLFRGDLLDAGLNEGFCAYKLDIGRQLLDLLGKSMSIRIAGTDIVLGGSPRLIKENQNRLRYLRPNRGIAPEVIPRLKRALNHRTGPHAVSIIMPVYNTPREWLMEALSSVLAQWCDRWELICVDDCSTLPHVAEILRAFSAHDRRVRVFKSPENLGIARATNIGLRAAVADYVTFMDHDDYLEPDAVYHLLRAAKEKSADFIYSDEATTDESIGSIAEVKARPSFSYDFYLSHPYFVHMLCMRRQLAYQVGGWDERMTISADVDFVLRLLETEPLMAHVPRVLYRWRTHETSTGHAKKDAVMAATRGAIQRHLDRRNTGATVEDGPWFNQFRVNWPASQDRILIVVPTRNKADLVRAVVNSVERTVGVDYRLVLVDHESTEPASRAYFDELAERHIVMPYKGPFNYSRMNNLAVKTHGEGCRFVLFLNNDVESITGDWLDRMRSLANREEVGAVGALLLYPDKRVQHAGVIVGFNGSAEATFKFEHAYLNDTGTRNIGYNCALTSVRDYSAVTAACLMMRRAVFEEIGGFDEQMKVGFNDVDLCLRVREAGYKVLYDGATVLYHYESATRRLTKEVEHPEDTARFLARHQDIFVTGDPFYNPNLSDVTQDHVLREDAGCRRFQARLTPFHAIRPPKAVPALTEPEPAGLHAPAKRRPSKKRVAEPALVQGR